VVVYINNKTISELTPALSSGKKQCKKDSSARVFQGGTRTRGNVL